MRVRGVSLVGSANVASSVSAILGYTYTTSQLNELAGGYEQIAGIPKNQVESSVDVHPISAPFGLTVSVNWVGEMFDTVGGFGNVPSGKYTVADLAGRMFLDRQPRHRINLRLENLFDKTYTTIHRRSVTDISGTPYLVHALGTPRTFHLSYGLSF